MFIRDERPEDVSNITAIQYAAFKGHPLHAPGAEPVEHRIVEGLREAHCLALSLLAESDGQAVGHIALSPAAVGKDRSGWFLLGPVGVLPQFQRRGIGSALVRRSLALMADMGAKGVVLVGDPQFYGRFGFDAAPGLSWPGVPEPFVLAVSFGQARPQGPIEGHEAFAVSAR